MSTAPARFEFKQDPNLLRSTILRQAGTLWKAILEGVMNSVDASATRCDITITKEKVTIVDDGRGFQSEEELEQHFQTFGTPHNEDDGATYGEFRMGRGQLMAFGVNRWTTNNYVMLVDIKDDSKGIGYELEAAPEPFNGCRVEIDLYDQLFTYSLEETITGIGTYVKYVSIPVTVNGVVVSEDPAKSKWDHVTDDAYINLKPSGQLAVYNLGVFVCDLGSYAYGGGGEVVSKRPLKLNFARNDIMRTGHERCETWQDIEPNLKRTVAKTIIKAARLNDNARDLLVRNILNDEFAFEDKKELRNKKLFTDVRGRHWSLEQLWSKTDIKLYTVTPKGSRIGERIHSLSNIFVFSQETADRLRVSKSPELLGDQLQVCYDKTKSSEWNFPFKMQHIDITTIKADYNETFEFLEDGELTERQRVLLWLLNRNQFCFHLGGKGRNIVIGESDVAAGWTDGRSYIALDIKLVTRLMQRHSFDIQLFVNLGLLIAHEYSHSSLDSESHVHDLEFHEVYDDILIGGHGGNYPEFESERSLARFVQDCMQDLPVAMHRANRRLTKRQSLLITKIEKGHEEYQELLDNEKYTDFAQVTLDTLKKQFAKCKKEIKTRNLK